MDQRPLRLGDIVDDYCPRERRITNHAIVALVEQTIRQTRCTTCDHEHVYKQAKEPKRRARSAEQSAFDQVLADVTGSQLVPARTASDDADPTAPEVAAAPAVNGSGVEAPTESPADETADAPVPEDGWPAHRQLIRATLPRVEGEQPPPRPIPEFTIYQKPPVRGRYAAAYAGSWSSNGHGRPQNNQRQGRPGGGQGQGQGQGQPSGHGRPHKPGRHRGKSNRSR